MKIEAQTIEDFFKSVPEKEADLREIDALIRNTLPKAKRDLKRMPSITLLAYWPEDVPKDVWPPIGLAPQKDYISLYVSGERDGQALGDYYAGRLGETNNGKSCVRFKNLANISQEELRQLILDAVSN
ncbi:MAG: DUF1801 domain-containing protein [Brevefilum sp.]